MNSGGPLVILYADDLSETQICLEDAGAKSSNRFLPFPAADAFISMTWMDTNSPYGPTSRTRSGKTPASGTKRTCRPSE